MAISSRGFNSIHDWVEAVTHEKSEKTISELKELVDQQDRTINNRLEMFMKE